MAIERIDATRTQLEAKHNLDINKTGVTVTVGNDCRTKLMYYLNCVSIVANFLNEHPDWRKYTWYETRTRWTLEEEEELYHICKDVITQSYADNRGTKEVADDIIKDSNEFFEVTDTNEILLKQILIHIDENLHYAGNRVIGAKSELKKKVMLYNNDWINKNYYNPLSNLSRMITAHRRERNEEEDRRLHPEIYLEKKREEEEERLRKEKEELRKKDEEERKKKRDEEEREKRILEQLEREKIFGKHIDRCCYCCKIRVFEDVKNPRNIQCYLSAYFFLGIVLSIVSFFFGGGSSSLFYFISFCLAPVTAFIGLVLLILSCCCGLYAGSIRVFLKYATFELLINFIITAIAMNIFSIAILLIMSFMMCGLYSQTDPKTRCECDCGCCNV